MSRHMRCIVFAVVVASAHAASAGERVVLDSQGYAWEQGGFPPGAPCATLAIPCIVTDLSTLLQIDLQPEEMTGWIGELVAGESTDAGNGLILTRDTSGTVHFWRDVRKDHTFAPDPPNAPVPSSFVNGSLCLGGTMEGFELYFDAATGSGAFTAQVACDVGDCLGALHALRAESSTFGAVPIGSVVLSLPVAGAGVAR